VVEHTALSHRQFVAVAAVVVLVDLVVVAAAGVVIAAAAAIEEGVHADVGEGASVAQVDAYAEVSTGLSQYLTGVGIVCCRYLHAWP
jgi:hypothetical protein